MVTEPQFQLTTRDHAILQAMLERHRGPHGPFAQLLERKVRSSAICFADDIPPGVVTLNTRLTYRVGHLLHGPHTIVENDGENLPPQALSIHGMRGLALLGLAERAAITIFPGDDAVEELRVEDVLSQPEAEARIRETSRGLVQGDSAGRTGNVVGFRRRPEAGVHSMNPDDDDPGPRAA